MLRRHFPTVLLLSIAAGIGTAQAQMPSIPGVTGGAGLPNVSSMGAGNAAGVLEYCIKNKLVGSKDASSVLGGLTGKPDTKSSPGYSTGQAGNILSGEGSTFSLDSAPKQVKSKVCDMVLKQGKSLL